MASMLEMHGTAAGPVPAAGSQEISPVFGRSKAVLSSRDPDAAFPARSVS